jgi:hypothetical protein
LPNPNPDRFENWLVLEGSAIQGQATDRTSPACPINQSGWLPPINRFLNGCFGVNLEVDNFLLSHNGRRPVTEIFDAKGPTVGYHGPLVSGSTDAVPIWKGKGWWIRKSNSSPRRTGTPFWKTRLIPLMSTLIANMWLKFKIENFAVRQEGRLHGSGLGKVVEQGAVDFFGQFLKRPIEGIDIPEAKFGLEIFCLSRQGTEFRTQPFFPGPAESGRPFSSRCLR